MDLHVDGGDRRCIALLIELRRVIADQAAPGDVIHLSTTDPAADLDLPAWCHLTGHTYLGRLPDVPVPTHALRVNAQAHATDLHSPWRPASSACKQVNAGETVEVHRQERGRAR